MASRKELAETGPREVAVIGYPVRPVLPTRLARVANDLQKYDRRMETKRKSQE
jgi:hypothetical protein